jgi:hypothetical protein
MRPTQCPKCKAALPASGRFCLECGLDLYAEGIHHRPIPWFHILVIPLLVAGVVAVLVINPFKRKTPPEVATVVRQSREFLELLGRKDYATAAERFLKADAKRLEEVKEKLRQICRPERVRLDDLRSQQFRSHEEVRKYLDNQPSPPEHPGYVARLLYAIISQPEPNPWMSPNRTERFLAWYLELAFSQADAANATLASEDPERGEGLLTVRIAYPAPAPPAVEGMPDPTMLRWRLMGNDWVLEFGTDDHLDEVLRFLRGLTPK